LGSWRGEIAAPLLRESTDFLVMNGDSFFMEIDFSQLIHFHR